MFCRQTIAGRWDHPISTAKRSHRHTAFALAQDRNDPAYATSRHLHPNRLVHIAEKIQLPHALPFGEITIQSEVDTEHDKCALVLARALDPITERKVRLRLMLLILLGMTLACPS